MAEPSASPSHLQDRSRPADKRPPEGECTPKTKLSFGISRMPNSQAHISATNVNPFAAVGKGNHGTNILKKLHEDLKEGWSFQGRKKHILKLSSPGRTPPIPSPHPPFRCHVGGEEKPDALRDAPFLLHLPWNSCPVQSRIL